MKKFQTLLDRYGSDFDEWPQAEAETAKRLLLVSQDARLAHARLVTLEAGIALSRPRISEESVRRVVALSLYSIQDRAAPLSFIDRFRILLAAPMPRVAFVMGLTGLGFVLGIAVGAPDIGPADSSGGPVLTASADDVLF